MQRTTSSAARFWLGLGLPVILVVLALGPYLWWASDLPDPLASHFNGSLNADGSASVTAFGITMGALVAAGVSSCVAGARRSAMAVGVRPMLGFLGGFVATLGATILSWTAWSQRDLARWEDASMSVWTLIWVFGASCAVGALAARLAAALADPETAPDPGSGSAPIMELHAGETAVWARHQTAPWLLWLAAGFVLAFVVLLAVTAQLWSAALMVVTAAMMLALASVRVRVDASGLDVKYGLLPYPRTRIGAHDIASAQVIDVRPMQWGGWGYRGSLKLMKQAAVVHRAGPGIRVDLHDGKVFVVTVDDPHDGVALLNAMVARQSVTVT